MFTKELLIQAIIVIAILWVVIKYLLPLIPSPFGPIIVAVICVGIIIWLIRAFF